MPNYLTLAEIHSCLSEIRQSFEALLRHRVFATRSGAQQWKFFRHAFAVLSGEAEGDYPCDRLRAAQYKFEINDRLRRYYLLPGKQVSYIFTMAHEKHAGNVGYLDANYPTTNEYLLLITRNEPYLGDRLETKSLIERVIADAIDAEWSVYLSLPELNLKPLEGIFHPDGGAFKRIQMLAHAHHKKGWTIANENNPSTRRLIEVRVEKLTLSSAQVRTEEYWYLRWWSIKKAAYVHVYNETNKQRYFLSAQNDRWLIVDNVYPPPKTSTPRRWRASH